MSGEGGNTGSTGLNSLAGSSVLVRDVLDYREKLLGIAIDDMLSKDHSVEMLESVADQ